jgi:hypothetical protein
VPAIKYLAAGRRLYLAFPPVVHTPGVPGVFGPDKKMIAKRGRLLRGDKLSHGHEKMVVLLLPISLWSGISVHCSRLSLLLLFFSNLRLRYPWSMQLNEQKQSKQAVFEKGS